MNVYATEEEQVEALKTWWKQNAKSVLGGVLIGVAVIYGGKTWLQQHNRHIEVASAEYEAMIQDLKQDKVTEAADRGAAILGQYTDTAYGALTALAMAKIKVDENDLVAAKSQLQWALDNAKEEEIKLIARMRLARVLNAEGKPDEALTLLNSVADAGEFAPAYDELKGDIYAAKGETEQAKTHYDLALQGMDPSSRARRYIEMKRDDLGLPAAEVEQS